MADSKQERIKRFLGQVWNQRDDSSPQMLSILVSAAAKQGNMIT
jgi:hypothetical protein